MIAPTYIKNLMRPNGQQPRGRKVWSIDLETVFVPFFTATNVDGLSAMPLEALGAPLRLAYDADGSVKFSKSGKPVIKVVKDIQDAVRLMRENLVAELQQYTANVRSKQKDAYTEHVRLSLEAGAPIVERDRQALDEAIRLALEEAMAQTKPEKEPVTA